MASASNYGREVYDSNYDGVVWYTQTWLSRWQSNIVASVAGGGGGGRVWYLELNEVK
jgi:hypothetical protein